MKRLLPVLGAVLVLVILGVGAIFSPDWFGLAAAVPPPTKATLDETEAKSTGLVVPSVVKAGEFLLLSGKLAVNTKAYQWGGNTTMSLSFSKKPNNKLPKAVLIVEVVRGASLGEGETVATSTPASIEQTSESEAKWEGQIAVPNRVGRYHLRVYFETYVPGRYPRKTESRRLIAEHELTVE